MVINYNNYYIGTNPLTTEIANQQAMQLTKLANPRELLAYFSARSRRGVAVDGG